MEYFLIIGADRGIGRALYDKIIMQGGMAGRTTRNKEPGGVYLDLNSVPDNFYIDKSYTCVFLCAARTAYEDCENDPRGTYKVNVEGTVAIAKKLLDRGCFVVFLSSSAVFDGSTQWPDETAECNPVSEYGKQKLATEEQLLKLDAGRGKLAIVRLTKVLTDKIPIINLFRTQIERQLPVEAFCDLRLSPVSMPYAVNSLLKIGAGKASGIYHLSGDLELSYADLARELAKMMSAKALIRENKYLQRPDNAKPVYPGLGMVRTKRVTGLSPQPGYLMFEDLYSEFLLGKMTSMIKPSTINQPNAVIS